VAITMKEKARSRPVNVASGDLSQTLVYYVRGTDDEAAAFDHAYANSPTTINGLVRRSLKLDPWGDGDGWDVEVGYGLRGPGGTTAPLGGVRPDPALTAPSAPDGGGSLDGSTPSTSALDAAYTFDIAAEKTKVTRSIRTLARMAAGAALGTGTVTLGASDNVVLPSGILPADEQVGQTMWIASPPPTGWYAGGYKILSYDSGTGAWTLDRPACKAGASGSANYTIYPQAPDQGNAVGVGADGKVEGCEVFTPVFSWTRTVAFGLLSRADVLAFRGLVGKKNRRPFYGSAAGEVLYAGGQAQASATDGYTVTHKFLEIENQSNIVIVPGELTVPFKRGWDYLWVLFEQHEVQDTDSGEWTAAPKPVGAYVEEVCADGDFDLLRIGK